MIKIDTTIPGTLAGIRQISGIVAELAAGHRLRSDVVADVHVALDEVLNNIITHAYRDDRVHEIRVRFLLDPHVLTVEIEDEGKPFNPLSVPAPSRICRAWRKSSSGFTGEIILSAGEERVQVLEDQPSLHVTRGTALLITA